MEGVRPSSTSADLGPTPAKHPRLQLQQPAQWDLERPIQPSSWQGQAEISPTSPLGSAVLDMCWKLIRSQPGSFSAPVRDSEDLEYASPSGMPWMNAPDDLDTGLHLSSSSLDGQVPDAWSPSASPVAESCAPWFTWSLKGSMLKPLPDSPLQSLPPSPPPNHQEQSPLSPVRPTRPPCKARRRLLF
ncbi:uncharacterized protein LOC546157 [Mus musculus]|jgi:hypothetical protein|uniref:Proline rich 23A, member 4 n=1 Tax=Mus musculus TaxID=10090 RepID=Q3UX66_MOUSE|nr:uncharacterized protein LOC546157 [Mus musculus]BAE22697.1 unnamed protein product [Mus musculus]|eukprot:NP_001029155.1 uncharacterized protein LOC546157 [Mus musculus]